MDIEDWESSSDSEVHLEETNDEEQCYISGDLPKLQFRRDMSKAIWNMDMGLAEVVKKKGSLWTTTGIVRGGKVYCSIEETLFLTEVGALDVLDNDEKRISLEDIYKMLAKGEGGCCWESFEVYRHLKSLGYIVGRHGVLWSVKSTKPNSVLSLEDVVESESTLVKERMIEFLNRIRITEATPVFDVYPPNSKFKKSSPGQPLFALCITSGNPPTKSEIEEVEAQCNGIPIKFWHVEHGRVSFFSFNKVDLPCLS